MFASICLLIWPMTLSALYPVCYTYTISQSCTSGVRELDVQRAFHCLYKDEARQHECRGTYKARWDLAVQD